MMQMPLVEEQKFEPLQVPPNIKQARIHEDAFKVGRHPIDSLSRCPCCNTSTDYELISLNCNLNEMR